MASTVIFTCGLIGCLFAGFLFYTVSQVSLDSTVEEGESASEVAANKESDEELKEIYEIIREGAQSFLWAEYQICFIFIVAFGTLILVLTSRVSNAAGEGKWQWNIGALTALSFVVGGLTSILSGYIGKTLFPVVTNVSRAACASVRTLRTTHARTHTRTHTRTHARTRTSLTIQVTARNDGCGVLQRSYRGMRQEARRGWMDRVFQLRLPCCTPPPHPPILPPPPPLLLLRSPKCLVSNSTHSDRLIKLTSIRQFCDARSTKSLPKHTENIFLVFGDNFLVVERSAAF